jgi:hypothetical protein
MSDASRSSGGAGGRPERAFLDAAARALALTAVIAFPVATALAGSQGALGAAAGSAFLVVLLGLSALLHVLAAPFGRMAWLGLTLGGLALRVALYAALILTLGEVGALNGTALGLTAALGIVIGQVFEMRALVRARALQVAQAPAPAATARKELEGVDR